MFFGFEYSVGSSGISLIFSSKSLYSWKLEIEVEPKKTGSQQCAPTTWDDERVHSVDRGFPQNADDTKMKGNRIAYQTLLMPS